MVLFGSVDNNIVATESTNHGQKFMGSAAVATTPKKQSSAVGCTDHCHGEMRAKSSQQKSIHVSSFGLCIRPLVVINSCVVLNPLPQSNRRVLESIAMSSFSLQHMSKYLPICINMTIFI